MGKQKEVRSIGKEIRAVGGDDGKKVSGLGVVYDEWTELWPGYMERINAGAVELDEVVHSYINHNPEKILGRTDNGTLELNNSDQGLEYNAAVPDTSYGRDLLVNLESRNIQGSSFTFTVPDGGDRVWQDKDGKIYREIDNLTLYEVGPVTNPAFRQTSAELRSKDLIDNKLQQAAPEPQGTPELNRRKRLQQLADAML